MPTIPLATERLLLREFVPSDWRAFLEASGLEELRSMHEEPYGEDDAKQRVAAYTEGQHVKRAGMPGRTRRSGPRCTSALTA